MSFPRKRESISARLYEERRRSRRDEAIFSRNIGEPMNYQYLHYDFFTTCRKRKITKTPMLLLIYLRGLYSRFGNIFTWKDKIIVNDLGINRKMLQRSRLILQEKGVIDFVSGTGPEPTQYLILDSVLAPERLDKNSPRLDKIGQRGGHYVHPIYKNNEIVKNKSQSTMPAWLQEAAERLRKKREGHVL